LLVLAACTIFYKKNKMITALTIEGEEKQVTFIPELLENNKDNERIWALKNGTIQLKFREKPLGHFDTFINFPEYISNTEELKVRINELLDDYIEQERNGVEPEFETKSGEPYPYDREKIKIMPNVWSVDLIFKSIERKTIDLEPDFQRTFVWDVTRQSRLIESILLGIPLPSFYLAKQGKVYNVVDGIQRLTTLYRFMKNKFTLQNCEYLKLDGAFFSKPNKKSIGEDLEFVLSSTQFNINIIEEGTPTRVKLDIFRRINTGGKPLNHQEMRNSILSKESRNLLKQMFEKLSEVTGISDNRMNGRELVMRFIGFSYIYNYKISPKELSYQGDMKDFLDNLVDLLNKSDANTQNQIFQDFCCAMDNAQYLFGNNAFRKCLPEHLESPIKKQLINKSLFTTWSVLLARVDMEMIKNKSKNVGDFIKVLAEALAADKNNTETTTSYFAAVSNRTNDRKVLEFAFENTKKLITKHLS
jgi:hypothetical protein